MKFADYIVLCIIAAMLIILTAVTFHGYFEDQERHKELIEAIEKLQDTEK